MINLRIDKLSHGYILISVTCVDSTGAKIDPEAATARVYRLAAGVLTELGASPYTLVKQDSKTGWYGYVLNVSEFVNGVYPVLAEVTIGEKATHADGCFVIEEGNSEAFGLIAEAIALIAEQIDAVQADLDNPDQYKADVSALAIEANVEGHAAAALTAYDPPTRAEATADKDEIISHGDEIWIGGGGGTIQVKIIKIRSDTHLTSNKIAVNTFIGDEYADVDGVALEDSTGTYGMKETVSGESLIDPGQALTKIGTGRYEITYGTLEGYDSTLDYLYAVKVTNEDQVIFIDAQEIEGMTPSGINTCRIKVDTVRLIGVRKVGVEVKFKIIERPQVLGEEGDRTVVLKDVETAETNTSGIAWIELTRFAKAQGSISDGGYKKKFIVPDEDEADLCDIPELQD